jgi:hypothetical protein
MDQHLGKPDWVARARVLAPAIEAAGARNEQELRIAPEIISAPTTPASCGCCCRSPSAAAKQTW